MDSIIWHSHHWIICKRQLHWDQLPPYDLTFTPDWKTTTRYALDVTTFPPKMQQIFITLLLLLQLSWCWTCHTIIDNKDTSQVIVLSIHRIRADTTITKISHNNVSITNGEDSTSNEGVNTSGALLWAITSAKMCLVQIILHAITNKIALLPTVSLKTRSFSMCKFAQSSSQSLCRLEHTSR